MVVTPHFQLYVLGYNTSDANAGFRHVTSGLEREGVLVHAVEGASLGAKEMRCARQGEDRISGRLGSRRSPWNGPRRTRSSCQRGRMSL